MKINLLHTQNNSFLKTRNTSPVQNGTSFKGDGPISAQTIMFDVEMVPYQNYLINEDTVFESAGYEIDLKCPELKDKIKNLRYDESLIIGRLGARTKDMPDTISARHLMITKNRNGNLTACDIGSTNGTTIKANIKRIPIYGGRQELEAGQYYLLPINAVVSANKEKIHLSHYRDRIKSLGPGQKLIVGRSKSSDIVIDNEYVSARHLELRQYGEDVLVKDLNSSNGSSFEYCDPESYQYPYPFPSPIITPSYIGDNTPSTNDYRHIRTTMALEKNIPTKIPKDCQISLGNHFCIDIRNKNILKLLNERGRIEIGRNQSNDIVINGFYDDASRKHLVLERKGNDILATDVSSMGTEIIPKNRIKAFNNGVEELVLGQSNIGDCYLLSTLYALSLTPEGRKYIEKMVSVDDNGNYIVNFHDSFMPISIAPEDLDGQKLGNSEKRSVCGALGVRAIERAYGRMIRRPREENMTLFVKIDKGGWPENALKKMTGLSSKVHNISKTDIKNVLDHICSNGINNYVLTCSTPGKGNYNGYVDPERRFDECHAYGIKSINNRNQTIEIVNPHNTKKSTIISWSEFSQYFDYLNVAKFPQRY